MDRHVVQLPNPPNLDQVLDIKLDGSSYVIHKFLQSNDYSDVYSIRVDPEKIPASGLVARAYFVDNIDPKSRAKRLKNLKRLGKRIIFETDHCGVKIAVIQEGNVSISVNETGTPKAVDGTSEDERGNENQSVKYQTVTKASSVGGQHHSDLDQNESKEVRHPKKKRTKKREKKSQLQTENKDDGLYSSVGNQPQRHLDDKLFTLCLFLHMAHDKEGNILAELSEETLAVLEKNPGFAKNMDRYLKAQTVEFSDAHAMEFYLNVKKSEVTSLQQSQSEMKLLFKHHEDIVRRQTLEVKEYKKGSVEWIHLHAVMKEGHNQLEIVRNAQSVIPKVIENAEQACADIQANLVLARAHALRMERKGILQELATCDSWYGTVVPLTDAQTKIEDQRISLEKKLVAFDEKHPDILAGLDES